MSEGPRLRVGAYAVVVRDQAVLLSRLSEASPVFTPGAWHLPGGGLEPGEQPGEALVRELHEEAGLDVMSSQLLDVRSYSAHRNGTDWHVVGLLHRAEVGSGEPVITEVGGSADAIRWVPIEEIDELPLSPPTADGLRMLDLLRVPA
ncbi:NUDIX hydrolase [Micromonospora sp. LOL_023]|uniref:NUDIX hydrolase n=1 Tax=Micromonospora sp. LOL_023 TaxID=3345418 RepID=UPI003A8BF190